jgi:hypothetical protein
MNHSKALMGLAAVAIGVGLLASRAGADPAPSTALRDIYGEADEEATDVTAAPTGMACGAWATTDLKVETSEPPEGFTGACLMDRSYGAALPSVCFSPSGAGATNYSTPDGHPLGPVTTCTIPAAQVVQPSWRLHVDPNSGQVSRQNAGNSYRALLTCVPHLAAPANCSGTQNGGCPCFTSPVSRSCCTPFATAMTSSDGQTAQGTVYFSK